jgi:hypothetical protein
LRAGRTTLGNVAGRVNRRRFVLEIVDSVGPTIQRYLGLPDG